MLRVILEDHRRWFTCTKPILTYCSSIWLPYTQTAFDGLIAIEHKFLRFVSKLTPVPMLFFNHDYTAIRKFLHLTSLRHIYLINDYTLAFKISKIVYYATWGESMILPPRASCGPSAQRKHTVTVSYFLPK